MRHSGNPYDYLFDVVNDEDDVLTNVFVYGSLKKGLFLNWAMQVHNSEFKGVFLSEKEYDMCSANMQGSFPVLLDSGDYSIEGEIYSVNSETLSYLDLIEGAYSRKAINVKGFNEPVFAYFMEKETYREIKDEPVMQINVEEKDGVKSWKPPIDEDEVLRRWKRYKEVEQNIVAQDDDNGRDNALWD